MSRSVNHLFCDKRFSEYRRNQQDVMEDEISQLTSDELKNSTDSLSLIFASKYTPAQITLHDPIKEDGGEVERDVSHRQDLMILDRSTPTYKTYKRIKVRLPFDGDRDLLKIRPGKHNLNPPTYASLKSNEIVYYAEYSADKDPDEIADKIQNEIENWVEDVEWYIEQLNTSIRKMESRMEQKARRAIERRRDTEDTHQQVMEVLDVDDGSTTDVGYVSPEKKRNIELPSQDEDSSIEVMPDQTFTEVLEVINDLGVNLQRSADRVRDLDEESLRDIFLMGINSHYAGLATGETFNRGGKTDILLRYENRNLFVAECKFWKGQSVYTDAIGQLLGNLTARDTHAALLVFSNRTNINTVRDRVGTATDHHDQYVTELPDFTDHNVYRFELENGTPVKIAVKVFDLQ